jgi:site-specific DNA-adenine methylase
MTAYQGGKKRIGKKIYEVINLIENSIYENKKIPYFEPFIGMAGVMKYFGKEKNRELYACDFNKDLICMWKALQKGWKPPKKCTKKKYEELKNSSEHSADRAFIGIVASWAGIFFSAYRLHYNKDKDFMGEGSRGLEKIKDDIMNVKFLKSASYDTFDPEDMVIYCDPPYLNNNLKTELFQNFNHDDFWETMRKWSENNLVIISESTAPKDFKKIWSTKSYSTNTSNTKHYEDCLFVHKSIYKNIDKRTISEIKTI